MFGYIIIPGKIDIPAVRVEQLLQAVGDWRAENANSIRGPIK